MARQTHTHRLARTAAVALAVTAIGAPAATARPMGETQPIGIDTGSQTTAPTVTNTTGGGFDWSSAGLGAGAAGAIVLLSLGGFALKTRALVRPVN